MFTVTNIIGNKVFVTYGELSFYVYIDMIDGKEVVSKPRSIYIKQEAFNELIKTVFQSYRKQESMNRNEHNS